MEDLPPEASRSKATRSPIDRYLAELLARYLALDEGTIATYIPSSPAG